MHYVIAAHAHIVCVWYAQCLGLHTKVCVYLVGLISYHDNKSQQFLYILEGS